MSSASSDAGQLTSIELTSRSTEEQAASVYATPSKQEEKKRRASSPTSMALHSNTIKSVEENVLGVEHTFSKVKSYRPLDVFAAHVDPSRSRFGLDDKDELPWDYCVVFDIPIIPGMEELQPGQTRRWAHPAMAGAKALNRRHHMLSPAETVVNASKTDKKPTSRSSMTAAKTHLRNALHLQQDADSNSLTCEDLITLIREVSGTAAELDNDGVEAESPEPVDDSNKPSRRGTIQRLAEEDISWLRKRASKKSGAQAPAVKHFPGDSFIKDIFNDVAEGATHVGARRFEIAKAFVIVGILARQCGLETYCHWSSNGDKILCLVRAEPSELKVMADKQDYSLPMAPHLDHKCPIPAYLEYDQDEDLDWLWARHGVKLANGEKAWSRFRRVDRLKLIDAHIDDFLVMRRLERLGIVQSYFPCDDIEEKNLRELHREKPLNIEHIKEYYGERVALYFAFLKHYKDSLYGIAFIGVVVQVWQVVERFVPILMPKNTGIPMDLGSLIYSAIISVWGTLFLERWKRIEARKATEWGMSEFESKEEPRPEFIGQLRESVTVGTLARRGRGETAEDIEAKEMADSWRRARNLPIRETKVSHPVAWYGKPVMWADGSNLKRRLLMAALATFSFVCVAIIATVGVFVMRSFLRYTAGGIVLSAAVGGAVNAGFIMLLQNIYSGFVVRLTDWENWETQTMWEDSRAIKTFVFNTVNSFGSFVYIAYIRKEYDSGCMGACEHATFGAAIQTSKCPKATAIMDLNGGVWPSNVTFTAEHREYKGDCVLELWIQLALIFLSRLIIGNILEIGIPICQGVRRNAQLKTMREQQVRALRSYSAQTKEKRTVGSVTEDKPEQSRPRLRLEVTSEKKEYDTFSDYAELVVQLGFLSLFVVCFPLAPVFAVLSNYVEVRVDMYKLTEMCKHPKPQGAQDIGTWQYFIMLTMYTAVVTNAALFAFTTDTMSDYPFNVKMIAFVSFIVAIGVLKMVAAWLIPDVPAELDKIRRRHRSLNISLVKRAVLWDNDDDEVVNAENFSTVVHWGSTPNKTRTNASDGTSKLMETMVENDSSGASGAIGAAVISGAAMVGTALGDIN